MHTKRQINIFKINLSSIFFLFIIIFGMIEIIVIPPFQKPDENTHFYRATALARGHFFCPSNNTFIIKNNFFTLPQDLFMDKIAFNKIAKFPKNLIIQNIKTPSRDATPVPIKNWCASFVGYVPNAIGIFFGILINSPLISLYLARTMGFLFFFVSLYIAVKLIPKEFRNILFFYAFIPMVLHQVTAISYDVVQLSLIPLIFSLMLRYRFKNFSYKEMAFFSFLLLSFVLVKPSYFMLLGLLFLLPTKHFSGSKKNYIIFSLSLLFVMLIPVVFLPVNSYTSSLASYPDRANYSLQLKAVKQDPSLFLNALSVSLSQQGEFYLKSMIGIFGWLDYELNPLIYYVYIFMLGFIAYKTSLIKKIKLSIFEFLLLAFIIISSVALIFFGLYLVYSAVGKYYVNGIQGRYFLVFLPFFVLILAQIVFYIRSKRLIAVSIIISLFILLTSIMHGIYLRYYDYSKSFTNEHSLAINENKITFTPITHAVIIKTQIKNRKIGGFEIYVSKKNNPITIPYKYEVKDSLCKKVIRQGFVDTDQIDAHFYYQDYFAVINPTSSKLCFEIFPYADTKGKNLLYTVSEENILFDYLYISQ